MAPFKCRPWVDTGDLDERLFTAEFTWQRTSELSKKALSPSSRDTRGVSHLSALRRHFQRLQLPRRAHRWARWCLCRGHKAVLEVKGMNCQQDGTETGNNLGPRLRCPWPFGINTKYYTLGIITETFISSLLNRKCQRHNTLKKRGLWRNAILHWMQLQEISYYVRVSQ